LDLDRHFIERNDFSAARRGYDPDEVDRHLGEIADAVNELKRSQKRPASSLAATAADQVRGIVEAAERSATEIQEQAEAEAKRIVDDASSRARETRERADSEAVQRVSQAEEATERMLERTNGVEGEIDRLLSEMRAAAGNLVENLRSSATSLNQELTSIREEYQGVRSGRIGSGVGAADDGSDADADVGAAAVATPEPDALPDEGPVDAEPEVVAEVVEVEETAVREVPDDDGYETVEEPAAAEAEPEPEEEAEEPAPAEEEAPAEQARGGRSIRGAEGARLIALNMALNGTPRDETARYLSQNFDLDDQDSLLDEVYARVGG
jgi:DivIVA domain-containing protein